MLWGCTQRYFRLHLLKFLLRLYSKYNEDISLYELCCAPHLILANYRFFFGF